MAIRSSPTDSTDSTGSSGTKTIRKHKKSRQGCYNCKLRSVKCDENKPACKRCKTYGVQCSYEKDAPGLQLSFETAATFVSPIQMLPVWPSKDDALLSKFQNRTALTISTGERLRLYQNEVVQLSHKVPFLRHAILAVTLMHDRMMYGVKGPNVSSTEALHIYKATSSFQRSLTNIVKPQDQAAIFVTSALLGNMTVCHLDATTPEEAWPLASTAADLDWMWMCAGKQSLPELMEPRKPDAFVDALAFVKGSSCVPLSPPGLKLKTLPQAFSNLFDNDVKCQAVTDLAAIVASNEIIPVVIKFMIMISGMPPGCQQRLKQKHPLALILLSWWYAKLVQLPLWWARKRGVLEGQSICLYLEKYFEYDSDIQALVRWPKTVFWHTKLPPVI